MATIFGRRFPAANPASGDALNPIARVRKFLWLSTGMFSAASFAIPFIGYLAYGTMDGASTNFPAAVVSACLFGLASLLHFGPETA